MKTNPHADATSAPLLQKTGGSDVRGAARLAFEAVLSMTRLVEAMHATIAWHPLASRADGRTRGITGLVYRSIRGVTHVSGTGVDAALALCDPVLAREQTSPRREAARAALNGVLGDHLAATANPLAIPIRLRRNGSALKLDRKSLAETAAAPANRLAIMVHGLCMHDLQWCREGHDHGAALTRDFGFTTLYLHYNSGLHISQNGRAFANVLETLVSEWPAPLEDIVIVGHSMGGLVTRSACHYAALSGHVWPRYLKKLIFLGSPHHGAPMERAGNWLHLALGVSRYTSAFTQLTGIRSAGITDLRYGNLLDEDWMSRDRFKHTGDTRWPVPLPEDVQCYAVAASTAAQANGVHDGLLGDGLVPVASALGQHKDPSRALAFPEARQWLGRDMNHFDLLSRTTVYEQMKLWLAPDRKPGSASASPEN